MPSHSPDKQSRFPRGADDERWNILHKHGLKFIIWAEAVGRSCEKKVRPSESSETSLFPCRKFYLREKARYSAEGRCSLDNPVQCKTRQTDLSDVGIKARSNLGDVVLSTKTTRQIDLGDVGVSAGPTRHFTLPCLPDPRFVRTKLTAVAEVSQAKVGRTVSKHQNRSKYTTEGKGRRGKGLSETLGKKTDRDFNLLPSLAKSYTRYSIWSLRPAETWDLHLVRDSDRRYPD
ncbi:hypothetical protein RRG08_056212 [Elysia crispata]|uniref:Uncharacterized protein n=1 Tax=Elysia crispata TaxID=231223 RepID=A0AAE0YLL2_9GAST|nr:hypothetical protein RRG08_056212 [Elysia crispata]